MAIGPGVRTSTRLIHSIGHTGILCENGHVLTGSQCGLGSTSHTWACFLCPSCPLPRKQDLDGPNSRVFFSSSGLTSQLRLYFNPGEVGKCPQMRLRINSLPSIPGRYKLGENLLYQHNIYITFSKPTCCRVNVYSCYKGWSWEQNSGPLGVDLAVSLCSSAVSQSQG